MLGRRKADRKKKSIKQPEELLQPYDELEIVTQKLKGSQIGRAHV